MLEEQVYKKIMNKVIMNKEQGYALYFKYKDLLIEKTNGLESDKYSFPITFNTCFRLASVSKQFIAYAIIILVEEKFLSFSTPIIEIFSDLPQYFNKITIRQLLNHTSGIYDYEKMPHQENDEQIKDEQILDFLKTTTHTYFEPGTRYQYSNTGYILLGQIIEKVSNNKINDYLNKKVFTKAKLFNTYVNDEGKTIIPNRAYGHILDNNQLIVKDQYWCSATIGDGGLYSNITDLNKWIDYLLGDDFDKLKSTMFLPNVFDEKTNSYYGVGMRIINVNGCDIYYHCGDTIGTNTFILFSKDLNLRCIFLTNLGNIDTENLKENIINLIN